MRRPRRPIRRRRVFAKSGTRFNPSWSCSRHNLVVPSTKGPSVVLFSGGRGSGALTRQLITAPSISLTIAINGYDDGASTGEVRRFLADALGPSDFRKNASRLASILETCSPGLIDALDRRLPVGAVEADARQALLALKVAYPGLGLAVDHFLADLARGGRPFNFSDCSVGNLIFAGLYLECGRDFNRTVDRYAALLGLDPGLIENVTDGTNAWLIGIDATGRLLASEEELVDSSQPNTVQDIFLIDRPLLAEERRAIEANPTDAARLLAPRAATVSLNPRLAERIAGADLIIYAPGTQHSSLFPSYLTPGLSAAIEANLTALKVLVTNIQADAEITGSSAVNIIDRAVYYLKDRGRQATPTPCLITHYVINDSRTRASEGPYVPLGPVDAIEDQRLVRIGNYEDGVTGQHDALRVLAPFIESIQRRSHRRRVAVLLHDAGSINKVVQTLLEMVRGGISDVPLDVEVFYAGADTLDPAFVKRLPFGVTRLAADGAFAAAARAGQFDYVVLFESSGMYRGENIVSLAPHLAVGRLDAVWGSRRLSVREIEASYKFRYHSNALVGVISYLGSYVLSLSYLFLYRRYISDTLSAVRAVRASDALDPSIDLTHRRVNHLLLAKLMRRKADLLEIPVQFIPVSPDSVKRISVFEGIGSLAMIVWRRIRPK
ncbi:MAG: hypothetical protein EPO35_04265 [Acidobacteria bacterium]|nr:MAG: hypothetical protein EPO35_04265 [Acidobacteriota bacterium]